MNKKNNSYTLSKDEILLEKLGDDKGFLTAKEAYQKSHESLVAYVDSCISLMHDSIKMHAEKNYTHIRFLVNYTGSGLRNEFRIPASEVSYVIHRICRPFVSLGYKVIPEVSIDDADREEKYLVYIDISWEKARYDRSFKKYIKKEEKTDNS